MERSEEDFVKSKCYVLVTFSPNLKTVDMGNWVWFDWSCISWEICQVWPFKAKSRKECLRLVLLQALMEFIETEMAIDLFFCMVTYIWVKRIIRNEKKNCKIETWFYAWLADWMLRCGHGNSKVWADEHDIMGRGLWSESCIHNFHWNIELLHSD